MNSVSDLSTTWRAEAKRRRINYQLAQRQRPDYDLPRQCASTAGAANRFLIKARREKANLNPL